MARCPNCGRETRRTIDWCCQWCGYPLTSGSYKKLDKTFAEVREERLSQQQLVEVEEKEPEVAPEPEPEVTPEPEAELEPAVAPEPEPEPEPDSDDENKKE